ncbi:ImmA/IrrE family metallo-endopeptidase [Bacillus hominis]|uniref:ImmA/IrrE family metallo-endopeptidase n=1 Tax=Bacillus hominis TaxID=2817478 RepID=UPI001BB3428C|nr:ImmA/IrrE family metallo-endopeptidase [Bacillus hominis]
MYKVQLSPSDLYIDKIAYKCNIVLLRENIDSYYIANDFIRLFVLDTRLSQEQQREVFFHDLCHVLRHAGVQGIMPPAFRELQESDAVRFTRHAAIPTHMLPYIPSEKDVIDDMSKMFQVTPKLYKKHIAQIHNRIQLQERLA